MPIATVRSAHGKYLAVIALAYLGSVQAQMTVSESSAAEVIVSEVLLLDIEQQQFDLTDEEVSRVERLRLLDQSYGVSNTSAVELLGKYARTDAERMEYARKYVTAMADNIGRSQSWGLAVYNASQESNLVQSILSANPMIEQGLGRMHMAVPQSDYANLDYQPPRKVHTLMIDTQCDECDEAFAKQFVSVMNGGIDQLDVVFIDSSNDDAQEIFDWAKSMAVSQSVLESGRVNLHVDDDKWRQMRKHKNKIPRLIKQQL